MVKRTLVVLGLGMALLGGIAAAAPRTHAATPHRAVQAAPVTGSTATATPDGENKTSEADTGPNVDVQQGDQTSPDIAGATGASEVAGPDTEAQPRNRATTHAASSGVSVCSVGHCSATSASS